MLKKKQQNSHLQTLQVKVSSVFQSSCPGMVPTTIWCRLQKGPIAKLFNEKKNHIKNNLNDLKHQCKENSAKGVLTITSYQLQDSILSS